MLELSASDNPAIQKFFAGPRGRAAQQQQTAGRSSSKPK
jgi:ABC-type transporter Mla maintaining outer membrane lipid asymmetry ATPase subunit MlaF